MFAEKRWQKAADLTSASQDQPNISFCSATSRFGRLTSTIVHNDHTHRRTGYVTMLKIYITGRSQEDQEREQAAGCDMRRFLQPLFTYFVARSVVYKTNAMDLEETDLMDLDAHNEYLQTHKSHRAAALCYRCDQPSHKAS